MKTKPVKPVTIPPPQLVRVFEFVLHCVPVANVEAHIPHLFSGLPPTSHVIDERLLERPGTMIRSQSKSEHELILFGGRKVTTKEVIRFIRKKLPAASPRDGTVFIELRPIRKPVKGRPRNKHHQHRNTIYASTGEVPKIKEKLILNAD